VSLMSFLIDLIIVAIIALAVIISAKRGFVRTAIEVAGFVLAFLISVNLGNAISNFTYDKVIEPAIVSAVSEKTAESASSAIDSMWDAIPDILTKNGEAFGISKETLSDKLENTKDNTETIATDISQTAIKPIATTFLSSLFSLVLFVVLLVVVGILAKAINKLFSFSVIGKLNATLGGILGIPKGLVLGYVFCILLTVLFFFAPDGIWVFTRENADKSYLYSLLMFFSPIK